jgi:RNA polymerase sigma-70 factor (ECF subfamily)
MTEAANPPDARLVERIALGDQDALRELYDRFARSVYSVALRITQQPAAAEETTQDVFLQLWRVAGRYDAARGAVGPWLLTMARNRALDFLRLKSEKGRCREDPFQAQSEAFANPGFEFDVDLERRALRVRQALRELPEHERHSIELAFFEGLTHSEIALRTAEPLGTVKSWIRNGLLRLRKQLSASGLGNGLLGESP